MSEPKLGARERVDFTLLTRRVPPIGGAGAEVLGVLTGPSWCGYCGYTGRVLGPVQASCPERHGWHRWLERCADNESGQFGSRTRPRSRTPSSTFTTSPVRRVRPAAPPSNPQGSLPGGGEG